MGGMVLETNMTEIMLRIEEQNKIEKEEVRNYVVILEAHFSTNRSNNCLDVKFETRSF